MINIRREIKHFKPIDINSLMLRELGMDDKGKKAVQLYNSAIEKIVTGNEDMAVLDLKKAVKYNVNFYEALNLLALCLSNAGEEKKAIMILERVIVSEKHSVRAFGYLKQIDPTNSLISEYDVKFNSKALADEEKANQAALRRGKYTVPGNETKKRRSAISEYIFMFALGVIISFLVFVLATGNPEDSPSNNSISKTSQDYLDLQEQYDELEREFKVYKGDNDSAEEKIAQLEKQKRDLGKQLKLFEVEDLIKNKNNDDAAELLLSLYKNTFTDTIKERYDTYYNQVAIPYLSKMLSEAKRLYDSSSYEDALDKYKQYTKYSTDENKLAEATYYIADCYKELGRKSKSKKLCNSIINNYAASSYADKARKLLEELND